MQKKGVKYKISPKKSNVTIFFKSLQGAHSQKLVDKMSKYQRDLASYVEDTERTRFVLEMDGKTDVRIRQTDEWIKWNQYTPLNFVGTGYNEQYIF